MKIKTGVMISSVIVSILAGCVGLQQNATQNAMLKIEQDTGLKPVAVPNTKKQYLGKQHRGYQVLFYGEAGSVWGRYAARLAMGEIGREVGGIMSFLTGSYESGVGGVAGSPLDRLLAKAIGQPLSVFMILKHGNPNMQRLDVLSSYANIKPEDMLKKQAKVGFCAGNIYSDDDVFAGKISGNADLMKRMKKMRCQYIRADKDAVSFIWSGQENDYSAMICEFGDYVKMLNGIMDTLADIADAGR